MKFSKPLISCLPLLLAAIVFTPAVAIAAPGAATLELDYGAGTPCIFNTTSGVSIIGSQAGVISATGAFGTGCPTGGGSTGPASISLTATPATVPINNPVNVLWSATADICRYDPKTSIPGPLANWPAQGDACIGALACSQPHSINATLTAGGTYTFGLTCTSGTTQAHAQQTVNKTASVVVTGAPPPQVCTSGPAGLTQQTTGDLGSVTHPPLSGLPEKTWSDVFGINWQTGEKYFAWPGIINGTTKIALAKNKFLSLKFTVPSGYPLTNGEFFPYGNFATNPSNIVNVSAHWAMSITPDCGNFMQPASTSNLSHYCYADFSSSQNGLSWVITSPGAPMAGMCNLNPGQPYYLNIITAPLNNPTQSNCPSGLCRANIQPRGSFINGALLP
ncbi:MAG: hypothetical protein L0H70_00405 [Xanthomonadales bacterium]|nr:hypothetical protein [Xanthomonadales bacterium]